MSDFDVPFSVHTMVDFKCFARDNNKLIAHDCLVVGMERITWDVCPTQEKKNTSGVTRLQIKKVTPIGAKNSLGKVQLRPPL